MKQVQFPAILDGISTKKDGSFKVVIETQELNGDDASKLLSYRQQIGYVTFTPNTVESVEVPKEQAEVNQKTQGQRIRNVLYRYWEDKGKQGTFEEFYRVQTEKYIELIKEKLG